MGKGSRQRKPIISEEEWSLRWSRLAGGDGCDMTEREFNNKVEEIRKRTGKPSR